MFCFTYLLRRLLNNIALKYVFNFYSFSYTKPKGQLPDYNSPIVLHNERTTISDFCNKLHRSIAKEFK